MIGLLFIVWRTYASNGNNPLAVEGVCIENEIEARNFYGWVPGDVRCVRSQDSCKPWDCTYPEKCLLYLKGICETNLRILYYDCMSECPGGIDTIHKAAC